MSDVVGDTYGDDDDSTLTHGLPSGPNAESGLSGGFGDILAAVGTEPHVPADVDHGVRLRTRLGASTVDVGGLPRPLVGCGCGECPSRVDPLADGDDDSGAFGDVLGRDVYARAVCDDPRPLTLRRAATAYYVYQTASRRREGWTSRLDTVRSTHGQFMDAERELLAEWDGELSTALLSLRVSPVEEVSVEGLGDVDAAYYGLPSGSVSGSSGLVRRWVPPLTLRDRIGDAWEYVRSALNRHIGMPFEYVWLVSGTGSTATPHLHVYVWVRDPDDEVSAEVFRPAVDMFVKHVESAESWAHPISGGESDAVVVSTSPTSYEMSEDQALHVYHERGDEGFRPNTAGFQYLMNQRPEWGMERLHESGASAVEEREALLSSAVSWASSQDSIGSSEVFTE